MQKVINLLSHGLFYTAAVSIESIAPFILAPVLTHYLSLYDYGLWAIFQSATAFLRPLLGLTLDDYVRMRYYQQAREKMVGILFSIIILSGLFALVLGALTIPFGIQIGHMLDFPPGWLWAIILCAWLYALFYILLAYFQFEGKHTRFAMIHAVQAGGTLALSIMLVMSGIGWSGAVLGKLGGLFCGCAIALLWIVRHFPKSAEKHIALGHTLELMAFGWRYLPNGMVVVVMILTDRLMLAHMLGVQAASLFAVAGLFPMVLFIAIQGFIFGWQPWCFSRLSRHEPGDPRQLAAGAAIYFLLLPVGGLLISWLACQLGPYVIAKRFHPAFDYVFPLTMAMVAQGFYFLARSILHFYRRLKLLSAIALAAMGINIALNLLLISRFGVPGSAWATFIAYAAAFLMTAAFAVSILRRQYLKLGKPHGA